MNEFLEKHNIPKLTREETVIILCHLKNESIVESLPLETQVTSQLNFSKNSDEIKPILHKLL